MFYCEEANINNMKTSMKVAVAKLYFMKVLVFHNMVKMTIELHRFNLLVSVKEDFFLNSALNNALITDHMMMDNEG